MSKCDSGLYKGTKGSLFLQAASIAAMRRRIRKEKESDEGTSVHLSPGSIRYSQRSVNGSKEITESMKRNGWLGAAIDVVRMDDGELTTLDNTRVVAARIAGIEVVANVHRYDEQISSQEQRDRFAAPRGGVPDTWGQAVENRIGRQGTSFKRKYPRGSYNMEKIN